MQFTDKANFLRHSNRKNGQWDMTHRMPDQEHFEDPEDDDGDGSFDDGDDNTKIVMRVKRAVYDLVHDRRDSGALESLDADNVVSDSDDDTKNALESQLRETNKCGFTKRDILRMYNNTFQENLHTITAVLLHCVLHQLKDEAKLEKFESDRWRAKNWTTFKKEVEKFPKDFAKATRID